MSDMQNTRIDTYVNFLDISPEGQMNIYRGEVAFSETGELTKTTRSPRHCDSSVYIRNDEPIVGERFPVLVEEREVSGK